MQITAPFALNLTNFQVVSTTLNDDGSYTVHIETTEEGTNCHRCKQFATYRHGKGKLRTLRHLPSCGAEVYVTYYPHRYSCACLPKEITTGYRPEWHPEGLQCTKAFADEVLLGLVNSTTADAAKKLQVTESKVKTLFKRFVHHNVNWQSYLELGILGMDEIAIRKGRKNYVSIITSSIDGKVRVLAVIKGRKKKAIIAFLRSIPVRLLKTITGFCLDMYQGYIGAVKSVFKGNVHIIIDRFHVAKLYRASVDKFKQSTLQKLKQTLPESEYKKLKDVTSLLRGKKEYYTKQEKEKLELLFSYAPELMKAYDLSLSLTHIFNTHQTAREARTAFSDWSRKVKRSGLTCFNTFLKSFKKYRTEISNYFINRNTSSFVEGFNNKVKVLKRRCYGLMDVKSMFKRLWLDTEGYDVFLPHSVTY